MDSYHDNKHWRVRPPLYEDIFSKLPNGGWRPPMAYDRHARFHVPDENGVTGQDGSQDLVAVADHLNDGKKRQ